MQQQTLDVGWAELPGDILQMIGGMFSSSTHVNCALRVCKSWQKGIPAGVQQLELDMNPALDAWHAKVEQLGQLLPTLSSCKAHVSTAVPKLEFGDKIKQLAGKLHNIQHLSLELSEGFELCLQDGNELADFSNLRSLTLSGGTFAPAAAARLLQGLALACPQLEELHVLPEPTCGLGDDEVPLLGALKRLKVLEFRAYRLSAVGLVSLTGQLPELASLSCHGLDRCLDAATVSCFASRPTLRELHLGCDFELPDSAMQQLRDVAGDLSMKFRWTDKLSGLLRTASLHLQARLVRLDLGCVRLAADPSTALMQPLAALTALSDLRMSVYSNNERDAMLTLQLSQLTALTNLQVLHLTKQHAYFPEHRRLLESSISVPLSAASAAQLAAGCKRLRALRLCLGSSDVTAEGLAELRHFSSLHSLCVSAEPFGNRPQPVTLDLLHLPKGLTSLELRNVDIITPPAALAAAASMDSQQISGQQQQGLFSYLDSAAAAASSLAGVFAGVNLPDGVDGVGCNGAGCVLGQLVCLKLESCRLRTSQLEALSLVLPSLQQLKLAAVAGLSDEGVAFLSRLTGLVDLSVQAPYNKALSQASLAALAPLRGLRYLSWQSDDLTSLGPVVAAFSHFTTLRLLSLSCTPATLKHACGQGAEDLLQQLLPYCHLDFIC